MITLYKKELRYIFAIFIFKLLILTLLPLTGDEAYFIKWAKYPSLGYYDHPPMVGWIIYTLSFINDSHIFFRLFAVVTTFIAAFVIHKIAILYKVEKEKAFLSTLIFLASPVDLLLLLMTNDVALLFFGSLGTLFLLYALEKQNLKYAILAGIFLGSAFLSKYFAVFLLFGLLLFSINIYRKNSIKVIIIASAVIFAFIAQNLYFNYNSCWNNILFNFFARTQDNKYGIGTVLGYFALMLYIFTPWGVYFLAKNRFQNTPLLKLITFVLGIGFFVFFIVSLKNSIGLHWFLLFTPFVFLLFSFLDKATMQKIFKYNTIFTLLHAVILTTLLLLPISLANGHKKYSDIVLFSTPQDICKEFSDDKTIFTLGYSSASLLSYACKKDVFVLFNNSKYGRLDDKLFDVREISHKDIKLFNKNPIEGLNEVCTSLEEHSFVVKGATFYSATCRDFNYDAYKKLYLDYENEHFYNIPKWLPFGECYFKQRYYK